MELAEEDVFLIMLARAATILGLVRLRLVILPPVAKSFRMLAMALVSGVAGGASWAVVMAVALSSSLAASAVLVAAAAASSSWAAEAVTS